jgi:hypothetical protein
MRPLAWTTLALLVLPFAGCAATPASGGGSAKAEGPVAPTVPYPGSIRERAKTASLPSGRDFDFGGGVRVRSRGSVEADEPGAAADHAADYAGATGEERVAGAEAEQRPVPIDDLAEVSDVGVRITWEALTVERELAENPRLGRRPQQGVALDLKTVLVSEDHPAARGRKKGKASTREKDGSQVAIVGAEEMRMLVKGLREAGFYKVSRPTHAVSALFQDAEARGRVTIEVEGRTATVLSMRGQGQQAATRDVPRIYSQAKQAVAAVRNSVPTLQVTTTGREPLRTAPRRGAAENRTLTEEEASEILGGDAPAKPVDDTWGLGR